MLSPHHINWRPVIGDPSIMGWVTVVAYVVAAGIALHASVNNYRKHHRTFWIGCSGILLLLGINKQLDLQSLLTDIGRVFAKNQGWYQERREVQAVFVVALFIATLIVMMLIGWKLRKEFIALLFPVSGLILLAGFILIRAVSFHHVDQILKSTIVTIRMNWLLELGGIAILMVSGLMHSVRNAAKVKV